MAYSGEKLTEEDLNLWRDYELAMWLVEMAHNDDDYGFHDRKNLFNNRRNFILDCYEAYDLEKDQEISISDLTGRIYYEEEE